MQDFSYFLYKANKSHKTYAIIKNVKNFILISA